MRLNLGLQKLIQGAKDVAAMKIVLAEEQKKLEVATTETMKMLSSLEVSSAEARKEGDQARINKKNTQILLKMLFWSRTQNQPHLGARKGSTGSMQCTTALENKPSHGQPGIRPEAKVLMEP